MSANFYLCMSAYMQEVCTCTRDCTHGVFGGKCCFCRLPQQLVHGAGTHILHAFGNAAHSCQQSCPKDHKPPDIHPVVLGELGGSLAVNGAYDRKA